VAKPAEKRQGGRDPAKPPTPTGRQRRQPRDTGDDAERGREKKERRCDHPPVLL